MVLVGGAEHYLRPRAPGQPRGQRGAVEAGHVDVQQQQVGLPRGQRVERGLAVADAAGEFDAVAFAEQRGQPRARQRLVIDDQYAHRRSP